MADDAASLAQAVRAAPGDGRHVVCLRTSQTRYASYAASAPIVPVGQLVASPKCACTQWLIGDLYASSLHLCSAVPEAASIVRVANYAPWRCAATASNGSTHGRAAVQHVATGWPGVAGRRAGPRRHNRLQLAGL